jgi:hypothetical protein
MIVMAPSNPRARSASAARAPAWPAPAITMFSIVRATLASLPDAVAGRLLLDRALAYEYGIA